MGNTVNNIELLIYLEMLEEKVKNIKIEGDTNE